MSGRARPSTSRLYSPRLLMLSARLAEYPLDETLPHRATARSRTCGSEITLGLCTDDDGTVSRIGMLVSACAVGQSSAAIMADGLVGSTPSRLASIITGIEGWLDGKDDLPDWPHFDALYPAREHRGRHGALLLPWKAALEALSSRGSSS